MAWSYRNNATHRNSEKRCTESSMNKTIRKTKNEMAGRRVHRTEDDGNKRKERQSKWSRGLEAYCKRGQGPPRFAASSKKKKRDLSANPLTINQHPITYPVSFVYLQQCTSYNLFFKYLFSLYVIDGGN